MSDVPAKRDADELRAIAARLEAVAERVATRTSGAPLAVDVFREVVNKGATLRASQGQDGTWYAYLVMPRGWERPTLRKAGDPVWMGNDGGRYWADALGATRDEALRKALKVLIDVSAP